MKNVTSEPLTWERGSGIVCPMDELEAIFDKLRKCMAGRVSESILIELDIAEIRLQQLLLREVAKSHAARPNAPAAPGVN